MNIALTNPHFAIKLILIIFPSFAIVRWPTECTQEFRKITKAFFAGRMALLFFFFYFIIPLLYFCIYRAHKSKLLNALPQHLLTIIPFCYPLVHESERRAPAQGTYSQQRPGVDSRRPYLQLHNSSGKLKLPGAASFYPLMPPPKDPTKNVFAVLQSWPHPPAESCVTPNMAGMRAQSAPTWLSRDDIIMTQRQASSMMWSIAEMCFITR